MPTCPPWHWTPPACALPLRNLLDNALRHSAGAPLPPEVRLVAAPDGPDGRGGIVLEVRDRCSVCPMTSCTV